MVTLEKRLPVVQDHSIKWLVNGYEAINNPELIKKVIQGMFINFLTYLMQSQAFQLCSTGEKGFNLSYESLASKEARQLLLEWISGDREFYKSLNRSGEGEEEDQDDDGDDNSNNEMVPYDEIDSSKTIDEAITDVLNRTPPSSLADIYADEDDRLLNESDTEDRGTGANLNKYTVHDFSTRNATGGWMEWNSK